MRSCTTCSSTPLHSTPFRVLSDEAKRLLFPQSRATIHNTKTGRIFDASYVITADDVAYEDDGDGDVLLLITGAVGDRIYEIPFFPHQNGVTTSGTITTKKYDVQLAISNRVLKCKCPHRLTVMPNFLFHEDRVPTPGIVGIGKHCGSLSQLAPLNAADPSSPLVRRVMFSTTEAVPEFTAVTWTIYRLRDKPAKQVTSDALLHPNAVVTVVHRDRSVVTLTESRDDAPADDANVEWARSYTNLEPPIISATYAFLEPHVWYRVDLELVKGASQHRVQGAFVLRLPLTVTVDHAARARS